MPPLVTESGPSEGHRKTALIVEGGAMRGAWAAGVLSFLHERGQHQFDAVYAASSGACSAAYFVAGMLEPGLTIWRDHARDVVRRTNLLRRKPLIDLAYLVDHIFKERFPLSIEAIKKAPTQFYIVLTDCHTGEPVYFHARDERIFEALRATASMPFATRGYDYVEGHPYADGGLSDPIPIRRALQDGATDITVVLTHNANYRLKPWPRFIGRLGYPQFPAVSAAWTTKQHLIYNASLDLIAKTSDTVRVRVFRPIKAMRIRTLTRAQKRIHEALALGRAEALQQLVAPTTPVSPGPPEGSLPR